MLKRTFLTLAFLLLPAAAWATDAPLVADTYVSVANPSLNFGNLPTMTIGGSNVGLLEFDLSTLPSGIASTSVVKATLQVFVDRVGTSGTISVAPLLGPWTESTVTNVTFPGSGAAAAASNVVNNAGEYVAIDVTALVQAWVTSPGSNFGVALTSLGALYLDSKESTTTSHPAKLDVTVAALPADDEFVTTPNGGTNTAAGYSSLTDPKGFYNTAFGESTLGLSNGTVYNTAIGSGALQVTTTGSVNTAVGAGALQVNTTGQWNQAFGAFSMAANTTGQYNTAAGFYALSGNTTGGGNVGIGDFTFYNNTTGVQNTAVGEEAGFNSTTGSYNTFLGQSAGLNVTTGNYNIIIENAGLASDTSVIRIGDFNQNRAFIAGIRGVATGVSNAVEVVIDSNGQLGTINSSRRFKNDIADMGDISSGLMKLRPVTFHYKQPSADGIERLEYGLIAEEVATVYPEAVTYTPTGETETIQYHKINAMMLNEIQRQHRTIQEQAQELDNLRERLAALEKAVQSSIPGPKAAAGEVNP